MPTYQDDPVIVRTHQDNAAFNGGVYGESPSTTGGAGVWGEHKAFGAVIGKALRPLAAGRGLIPILIALQ
jgi:hypothetical protein